MLIGELRGRSDRYRRVEVELGGGIRISADLRSPTGRRLFAYGFCEPAAAMMQSLLSPGDGVIDAGANIGLYTLLAAARVGREGWVIACEPSPATTSILRENIGLNDLDHVQVREVAVAEAPGRLPIQVLDPGSGATSFAPADTTAATEIDVEVTTIDALAAAAPTQIRLVKIDVEGAELRALRGAARLLESQRPDFIVEVEPEHLERQGSSIAALQALFEQVGYVGHWIGGRPERIAGPWRRPDDDPNILVRPRERAR